MPSVQYLFEDKDCTAKHALAPGQLPLIAKDQHKVLFYVLRIYSAVAAVSLNVNMYIYTQFQGHAQTVSDVIMKQS